MGETPKKAVEKNELAFAFNVENVLVIKHGASESQASSRHGQVEKHPDVGSGTREKSIKGARLSTT